MSNNAPLTTGQAARYCHVSQATIVNWIKDGKLEAYTTPGGHYRIPQSDLVSFLELYKMPISAELRESQQPRVLLVGDSPRINHLANRLDEGGRFDISLASSDYAASAQMAGSHPHAVVIDMSASSDPLGLCRWVRGFSEDVALVVLGDPAEEAVARAAGAQDCLGPNALADLEARLEGLLR
jgi:excisionase family DNA binding protein